MGLFSSSWKYYAFAATSPLLESEADYPHTFNKVLYQGLSADDDFINLLRYTMATDMYARAKAMVRYATKEVDPYIRGLPESNLLTSGVQKIWVNQAILREIKMPLEEFFWFRHGLFDAQYVGCKFIHDHYMDIDYFPWPNGCLPDIKNPNFDDGADFWLLDDFQINNTTRVAEMLTNNGTLFSEMVGQINPGDIISLRATCSRGSDDPGQTGQINITFYDSLGDEISTASAANTTTPGHEWELLTVIATAPAGAVTCKAWAGGTMGSLIRRLIETVSPDDGVGGVWAIGKFFPVEINWPPGTSNKKDFAYNGHFGYEWSYLLRYTDTDISGADQWYWKVTVDSTISGSILPTHGWESGPLNTWYDIWTEEDELELFQYKCNGVMQWHTLTISIAESNGAGAPDLSTVVEHPFEIRVYNGQQEIVLKDLFDTYTGDLDSKTPALDRRHHDAGGAQWNGYYDVFYDHYGTWDYGWISTSAGNHCRSNHGDVTDEALYAIDSGMANVRIEAECVWDADDIPPETYAGGGIVARLQDYANFWILAVKNPADANPLLGIYKVVDGVHTLLAGTELPAFAPFTNEHSLMLTCHDDSIKGEISFSQSDSQAIFDQNHYVIEVTDDTFSTATKIGLWAQDYHMVWNSLQAHRWPLGAIDWDIFVLDTNPVSLSATGAGYILVSAYFNRNSLGLSDHPYHATISYWEEGDITYESYLNWRLTEVQQDQFLIYFEALSGDTADVDLWELGSIPRGYGEWMDVWQMYIALSADDGGSKSASIRFRLCLDDGTGSLGDRKPLSGTETEWKTLNLSATSTGP